MSNTFLCRIQYLDDSNPFVTSNFPEPTRPPTYAFLTNVSLNNQIANIHNTLNAPLKVCVQSSLLLLLLLLLFLLLIYKYIHNCYFLIFFNFNFILTQHRQKIVRSKSIVKTVRRPNTVPTWTWINHQMSKPMNSIRSKRISGLLSYCVLSYRFGCTPVLVSTQEFEDSFF